MTELLHERVPASLTLENLAAAVGARSGSAILESGQGFGPMARWSILAPPPVLVFEASDDDWTITEPTGSVVKHGSDDPLTALGRWLEDLGLSASEFEDEDDRPPFTGGLIGFFGYDLAPRIERLPRRSPRVSRIPDIRFGLHDICVTVDNSSGVAEVWGRRFPADPVRDLDERWRQFRRELSHATETFPRRSVLSPPQSAFGRSQYVAAVRTARDYIAAGDIFQVNLSQRFSSEGTVDPLDLFLRLRKRSPAPHAAFLRWRDLAVVSASPECFFATRGDRIVTRPIKGTRPRGLSPEDDARLVAQLTGSLKDRAELTMIVDLERNDLGRICRYGSVMVTESGNVESFAQVHHRVATIEGRLRPGTTPMDVIQSVFPGGSITGAPKIRAMEIIDELEPNRRGLYTGAIGYYGVGTSAFNIAIRTILVEGDRASYQVGGGIVDDSDPEAEYEETLHKGRAMFDVLSGDDR